MAVERQSGATIPQDDARVMPVPPEQAGKRLDKVLAELLPDYSRSWLQNCIKNGQVTVDGEVCAAKHKLAGGERLQIYVAPPPSAAMTNTVAEAIPLEVVHADADLLVINKPAGLLVHPGAGHPGGTLQNALLHHYPEVAALPRYGIVHRLDKDTSGLLVVARSLRAHTMLTAQIQARSMAREYLAVVYGQLVAGGTIEAPLGRHARERKKISVREGGRHAVTHYRIHARYRHHTALWVKLETGRTHQIRVHFAHRHHPLVGDPLYGRLRLPKDCAAELQIQLRAFKRQALHAARLSVQHPADQQSYTWEVPPPADLQALLAVLEGDAHEGRRCQP